MLAARFAAFLNQRLPLLSSAYTPASMMSTSSVSKMIAICQMNCNEDKERNWSTGQRLIREAKSVGACMAFLPECFDMICQSREEVFRNLEPVDGPTVNRYRSLAKELGIWLSLGGLHEKRDGHEKMYNTHLIINDAGEIVSKYVKLHLFNLDVPGTRLIESEFSVAGNDLVPPVQTPVGRVGQGICYDVRFPEMAIALAKAGADILTYPSSFTVTTGLAHWETLLRCRAIENQCYVVAAGQVGVHSAKRSSYGHSMIIDPWGAIVAQCSDGEGLAVALINPQFQANVRSRLPIWTDRRSELYGEIIPAGISCTSDDLEDREYYKLGSMKIPSNQVFFRSKYSFAFINQQYNRHYFVSLLREDAHRMTDLQPAELADLMLTMQKVQRAAEAETSAKSSILTIQDGSDANHVCAHIIPNGTIADFQTDKAQQQPRTLEEMAAEAGRMRRYLYAQKSSL